ncbi:MAG TPA: dihydrodipicolinate synthase family protein [Verrucomicrobiae bacterium]|nr:dihydrodipicolinate synthase family protein [Verrucomicrobiae bacterium]
MSLSFPPEHRGVVVPMVTPVTTNGALDERAADRLIESLVKAGVNAIFVAGTTGESAGVPRPVRRRLVECTVATVRRRVLVYAGLGDLYPDEISAGNEYLRAGADAVVARPPVSFPPQQLLPWFRSVLAGLEGPVLLYNIPATTNVSIPLTVVDQLVGNPKLVGLKDSENDPARLEEVLEKFGDRPQFSVLIGVGSFMLPGLRRGAEGIVPSVANLIPDVCQRFYESARRGNWEQAERHLSRMSAVTELYQKGRILSESLAVLKTALAFRGLCGPDVLPPLHPLSQLERNALRKQMLALHLLEET